MTAELYLARRYLLNHRQGAWGWMIGWLATGSVALGVAALIVTLAVMTGFREDIRQKILGIQPHVILTSYNGQMDTSKNSFEEILQKESRVVDWSPYVSGQVLIGKGGQSSGAMLKGIVAAREIAVANLEKKLLSGQWSDLTSENTNATSAKARIFLGQELARNLGVRLGDTVWIVTPGSIGISAFSVPQAHLFVVAGVVQSGLYDYDASLAYVNLPEAQKLFDMKNSISGVGMRVKDLDRADEIARDLQVRFEGAYWVRSWLSLNRNLFSALKLEKTVMFIILIMVTLVASVMIVSNLLLSITQKTKEIGILRAMGATGSTIHRIFLLQGVLMGSVGTMMGTGLGVVVSLILAHTNLIRLPADVYYIDHLPVQLEAADIITVVFAACLIVLVATLYPARRATQLDPLDAIRYG